MALFGFGKKDNAESTPAAAPAATTPAPAASAPLDLGKKTGTISLSKGSRVTIEKTAVITARTTWSSNTDYDLYALVLMRDGSQKVVSTFGSEEQRNPTQSILNGAVKHLGDIGRGAKGLAEEVIEIRLTDDIEAVVPVAYSAQSNGTGSFKKYQVSLSIDNGAGTQVNVDASNANDSNTIYSVAIGVIRNTPNGVVIESLEAYSRSSSENRPAFVNGQIVMDAGSKNLYK
jgi:tellurite resistance protein TerA